MEDGARVGASPPATAPGPSAAEGPRSSGCVVGITVLVLARLWGCALSSRSFLLAGDADSEPATK